MPVLLPPPLRARLSAWAALWLALLLGTWGGAGRAGSLPGELPSAVGRLNMLAGEGQLADRDSGAWQAPEGGALRNWPLTGGDRLRTGRGGRAELRFGHTTVRLGERAELWLLQADDQGLVLQLQAGSLAVALADGPGDGFGPVLLRTREGRWLPQRPGHYRLDREADATQATAWRGELVFEAHDSALSIGASQRADLWLDGPGRRATTRYTWAEVSRDAFADWVARDERQDDAPVTARHVPAGLSGWQDLERHGDWVDDAEHGALWRPRAVAPGWQPFHEGRWAWVAPWGWTWIDAAPWGFVPFHHGRWLSVGGHWAWSPRGPGHRFHPAPVPGGWAHRPVPGWTGPIGGHHHHRPPHLRGDRPGRVDTPAETPDKTVPRAPWRRDNPAAGRPADRR